MLDCIEYFKYFGSIEILRFVIRVFDVGGKISICNSIPAAICTMVVSYVWAYHLSRKGMLSRLSSIWMRGLSVLEKTEMNRSSLSKISTPGSRCTPVSCSTAPIQVKRCVVNVQNCQILETWIRSSNKLISIGIRPSIIYPIVICPMCISPNFVQKWDCTMVYQFFSG